jgi:hypothetical protein
VPINLQDLFLNREAAAMTAAEPTMVTAVVAAGVPMPAVDGTEGDTAVDGGMNEATKAPDAPLGKAATD